MAKLEMLLPDLQLLVFLYLDLGEDPTLFTPHVELQWRRHYILPDMLPNYIFVNDKQVLHSLNNKATETTTDGVIMKFHRFGKVYKTIKDQRSQGGGLYEKMYNHRGRLVFNGNNCGSTSNDWYYKNGRRYLLHLYSNDQENINDKDQKINSKFVCCLHKKGEKMTYTRILLDTEWLALVKECV